MTSDRSRNYHAEYADRLARANDYHGAYIAYTRAWWQNPDNARFAERAGGMAERSGNSVAAVEWYAKALGTPGVKNRTWYAYGRALEKTTDWEKAGFAFRQYARRQRKHNREIFTHDGGLLEFSSAIRHAAVDRPDYAHSVRHAALLAQKLGVPAIRVAELGVASGRGLLALQDHAETLTRITGVDIEVWGFDTGEGLPEPDDYRDLPHYFGEGDYTVQDLEELLARLEAQKSQLVLGDAVETVKSWIPDGPPIGALLFDMDLYSSTSGVLEHLGEGSDHAHFLPRVSLTFDDVMPKDREYTLKDYSSYTGEAAAISDFNEQHQKVKVDLDRYLVALPEHTVWHDSCYVLHRFEHSLYNTRIRESAVDHRPLQDNAERGAQAS